MRGRTLEFKQTWVPIAQLPHCEPGVLASSSCGLSHGISEVLKQAVDEKCLALDRTQALFAVFSQEGSGPCEEVGKENEE